MATLWVSQNSRPRTAAGTGVRPAAAPRVRLKILLLWGWPQLSSTAHTWLEVQKGVGFVQWRSNGLWYGRDRA